MTLPAQVNGLDRLELPPRPVHLAIGMFDGVHLGHRAVIDAAVQSAHGSGGIAGVLTFWPHPSTLFRPQHPTRLIQSAETKARMLATLGVDVVITQQFTHELAAIPADEFLPWLKGRVPRLTAVYVGENFRFGQGRKGDVTLLITSGRQHGVRVFNAARVRLDGESISSTRIRGLLEAGEMEPANALLGYSYSTCGKVTPGKRLGRTIGIPTLNVPWAPELKPRYGVYAVRVSGEAGSEGAPAVANYGLRPTVEQSTEPRLEVHVLGECPWQEGDRIRVEWLRFLRPEMKFSGLDALREQIVRDRAAATAFFSA